jgi:hypothetical protein
MDRGEFIALNPKCYYALDATSGVKRSSKGVPHNIDLTLQNYKDVLYKNTSHSVTTHQLRTNTKKQMIHAVGEKIALTDIFVKMHIAQDKITCSPIKINNKYI